MAQHKENDFVIPALMVIFSHGGDCTTEIIKNDIVKFIQLSDEDLETSASRNEPKYRQIIGNLISHNNKNLFKYVTTVCPESELDKKSPKYLFTMNDSGKQYIRSLINTNDEENNENIDCCQGDKNTINSDYIDYDEKSTEQINISFFDKQDLKLLNLSKNNSISKRIPSNRDMIKNVNALNNYTCQYALLIGKKHTMFNTKDNSKYVEGHHIIPMNASKDFFPRNLDRPCNIVSLCPECHAKIHHGDMKTREKMLRVLYDKYISGLNDEEIYISFENLLKYYDK